jgi:hypothetical protein
MNCRRQLFKHRGWLLGCTLTVIALTISARLQAQTLCTVSGATYCPGDNAVYNPAAINAHSFIDASQVTGTGGGTDICALIDAALVNLATSDLLTGATKFTYAGHGVVDARNIGGTALVCTYGNPWPSSSTAYYWPPAATVLLPAGTIQVTGTWTLPPGTRLVGEGPQSTIIQATSGLGTVIQMGTTGFCGGDCNGVIVEHLGIDEHSEGVVGISNNWSQELNYVNDVSITNVPTSGTGLMIVGAYDANLGNAANSGPYSNIYVSGSSTGAGTCVNLIGTYGTRGIHGLNCVGGTAGGTAAVLLDGSNNTIEDITISNYTEGILIGSQLPANAQNNVLLNIQGSSVTNLVHVCGSNASTNCPTTTSNPTDLTFMGISSGSGSTNTIVDEVTNTTLSHSSDATVALYLVGEPMTSGNYSALGYSRFTSSPSVPAWFSGPTIPSNTSCTANGSLYSVTSGTTAPTLFGCIGGKWTGLTTH